jgi:hypothetical protein
VTFPNDRIRYRDPYGETVEAKVVWEADDEELPATAPLRAGRVRLDVLGEEFDARYLVPVQAGPGGLDAGFDQIDNEILVGLRVVRRHGEPAHPLEVPRLIGWYLNSAEPFVLTEPPRGERIGDWGRIGDDVQRMFQKSLLHAVQILGGVGVAHRNLNPDTVLWNTDTRTVQLTGFAHAAPFGAPRTVAAVSWQAPEQRAKGARGQVGETDDVWAISKLIFYAKTGKDISRAGLEADGQLNELLRDVGREPGKRPSPRELARRVPGKSGPPVPEFGGDPGFERGRAAFRRQRARKHPEPAPVSDRFDAPIAFAPAASDSEPPASVRSPVITRVWAAVVLTGLVAAAIALSLLVGGGG